MKDRRLKEQTSLRWETEKGLGKSLVIEMGMTYLGKMISK